MSPPTDNILYIGIVCLAACGIVGHYFFVVRRRHNRDFREHLEPVLAEHSLRFVASVFPGAFKVGPFPKVEVSIGRPQSRVSVLGRGEYNEYRIVTVSDAAGHEYRLWALLEFELFQFRRVRWRVEPGSIVPDAMQNIIEAD